MKEKLHRRAIAAGHEDSAAKHDRTSMRALDAAELALVAAAGSKPGVSMGSGVPDKPIPKPK